MDLTFDKSEEDLEEDSPDLIDPNLIKAENFQVNLPTIQCLSCPQSFNSEYLLNVHKMLHDPKQYCIICKKTISKNFDVHVMGQHFNQCNLCLKTFTVIKAWKKHMELHTGNLSYIRCDQCDKVFRQKGSLTSHIRTTHQGLKPFTCTKCEKNISFTTRSSLNKHMRRFHNDNKSQDDNRTTKCRYCPEKLENWYEIRSHESNHMISKFCKECNLTLDTNINFRKHFALVHPNPELSTCFECWMSFRRKNHLNDHIKNAHGSIKYHCEKCEKNISFTASSSLNKHMRRFHNVNKSQNDNPTTKCRYCPEKLKNWYEIRSHESNHMISKFCKECNLTLDTNINFRKHFALVHPNPELSTCFECWMSFRRKNYLNDHIRNAHESIKYHCELCRVKFTRKVNLAKHMARCHDVNNPKVNVRIYTCRYCSEKLKNWQEKKRHESMHKISKSCKECNLTFTTIINFRKHFALVHPRPDLSTCDKCWIFFKRKRYLDDHIKTTH